MSAELTQLPAAETVRRLKMAAAVVPTIVPATLDMGTWFHDLSPEALKDVEPANQLHYDKGDVHICGTAACFAGHMATRAEFQALGLGLEGLGVIDVAGTTPLPDGRICRQPELDPLRHDARLAWLFGITEDEADMLFDPSSRLHTCGDYDDEDEDQYDDGLLLPEASLAAIACYITDTLLPKYEALALTEQP